MPVLTIGDEFPAYRLTALKGGDLRAMGVAQPDDYFEEITEESHPGKWRVVFFWPKDFTFVCPTEIAAFGRLNGEFEDRDVQISESPGDNEFCHFQWRAQNEDLKTRPPSPCSPTPTGTSWSPAASSEPTAPPTERPS